jgi:microcystin-dependent protein
MSQPYIGEIRCFGFQFAPVNWAFCDGQLMSISDNAALYNLIGTTFGGDGINTFAMPNLQGRVPMHWGTGTAGLNNLIGQVQGAATVTLTTAQMPLHTHTIGTAVVAPGGEPERTATPTNSTYIGTSNPDGLYKSPPPTLDATFASAAIGNVGGSPHENMQPYLALNFCICLFGIYPSQT